MDINQIEESHFPENIYPPNEAECAFMAGLEIVPNADDEYVSYVGDAQAWEKFEELKLENNL